MSTPDTTEWRPIETAPKDGTHIACCAPGWDYVEVRRWVNYERDSETLSFWAIAGEYRLSWMGYDPQDPPTLWVPVPPVPAAMQDDPS